MPQIQIVNFPNSSPAELYESLQFTTGTTEFVSSCIADGKTNDNRAILLLGICHWYSVPGVAYVGWSLQVRPLVIRHGW